MRRGIIETERVRQALNDARARWPRADDAWEAATLVLAYDPEEGTPVTESGKTRAFTYQGSTTIGMPTLTVMYEDQDPHLIVQDVLFAEPKRYVRQVH